MYIARGLKFPDLEDIHSWLVDDYNAKLKAGLLYDFMTLVEKANDCWGLFHNDMCIGVAYFKVVAGAINIEIVSVHPDYRGKGLGRNFVLTLISFIKSQEKIHTMRLNSLPDSVKFWEHIGFVKSRYQPVSTSIKMIWEKLIEYDEIPMIEIV